MCSTQPYRRYCFARIIYHNNKSRNGDKTKNLNIIRFVLLFRLSRDAFLFHTVDEWKMKKRPHKIQNRGDYFQELLLQNTRETKWVYEYHFADDDRNFFSIHLLLFSYINNIKIYTTVCVLFNRIDRGAHTRYVHRCFTFFFAIFCFCYINRERLMELLKLIWLLPL